MKLAELHKLAVALKVERPRDMKKKELIEAIASSLSVPATASSATSASSSGELSGYGHVLSMLTRGTATSLSDLKKDD